MTDRGYGELRVDGILRSCHGLVFCNEVIFDPLADPVSHRPEDLQPLLLRAIHLRRILEGPVLPVGRTGEERTRLVGLVAYGDYMVERLPEVPVQGLGLLVRDV